MRFKYILYINRPNTLVNSRNVPIDGGTNPSMNMFGFSSPGMSELLRAKITIKKEIKSVTAKNTAAPIMKASSLRLSRLVSVCANYSNKHSSRRLTFSKKAVYLIKRSITRAHEVT